MRAFVLFFSLSDDDLFAAVKGPWRRKEKKKKNTTVSIEIKRFRKRKRKAAKHLCKQKSYSIIHVKALLNEKRKKKKNKKKFYYSFCMREMSFLSFLKVPFFFLFSLSLSSNRKKKNCLLCFSFQSPVTKHGVTQFKALVTKLSQQLKALAIRETKESPRVHWVSDSWLLSHGENRLKRTRKMTHKLTFHCNSSMCTEKEKHTCAYQCKLPSRTFIFHFVKKQKKTPSCAAKLSSSSRSVAFSTQTHAYDRQSTASF